MTSRQLALKSLSIEKCLQRRAEQVLNLLEEEANFENETAKLSRNALFARLYYFTTRNWLIYARTCDNPALLYLVVDHFYRLYRQYVADPDPEGRQTTVRHWKLYHKLVDLRFLATTGLPQICALFLGVKAHTRYDLAEAICHAHVRYQHTHRNPPGTEEFRKLLFGAGSNNAFRSAFEDFIRSFPNPPGRMSEVLRTTSPLWLPVFQTARRMAWYEARRSISSGVSIHRAERVIATGTSH